jgi:hypothetical protein
MVGTLVCCWYVPTSEQCLFCLHKQWYQKAFAPIYDLQVSRTFPNSVRTLKRLTNNWTFYAVCEGKPTMLSLLWYFLQRLVIVSNMDNYGAASPTWILALAKLTRKGLFESYQLMQTSSATTSTMKWCHSVRLLHSKCTSVSHAMHQSERSFLVVCTVCVCVCVCVEILVLKWMPPLLDYTCYHFAAICSKTLDSFLKLSPIL